MTVYSVFRSLLFLLDAELSHDVTVKGLKILSTLLCSRPFPQLSSQSQHVSQALGLFWPNHVGLAAGFDKYGDYIDSLAHLGFGFIEIGTITPRPQQGNQRPRLFRLPEYRSVINCMGFNNAGMDYVVAALQRSRFLQQGGIVGVNIGRNATTSNENALEDYQAVFSAVYPWASYVVVNISSPNTMDLRALQSTAYLAPLVKGLKESQDVLSQQYERTVPLLVKISPDVLPDEAKAMLAIFRENNVEGLIVGNTTIQRSGLSSKWMQQAGGLSGDLLYMHANKMLELVAQECPDLFLIGVGGISSAQHACEKKRLGATVIQLYTGLVYEGPGLVKACVDALASMN